MKALIVRVLSALSVLMAALVALPASSNAAPAATLDGQWHATGITINPNSNLGACFDSAHPNSMFVEQASGERINYNWASGQRLTANSSGWGFCGPDGAVFGAGNLGGSAWRITAANSTGEAVAHMPTHAAHDGSHIVYSFESEHPYGGYAPGKLWYSPDNGSTWTERGQQFAGQIVSLAVANSDARAIYIVTATDPAKQRPSVPFAVYYSADAGATWEQRFNGATNAAQFTGLPGLSVRLEPLPGSTAPVNALVLRMQYDCPYGACDYGSDVPFFSYDGGRSFSATAGLSDFGFVASMTRVVHTGEGFLQARYFFTDANGLSTGQARIMSSAAVPPVYYSQYQLSRSTDNGATWQTLAMPAPFDKTSQGINGPITMLTSDAAPGSVVMEVNSYIFYSPDGGRSWQSLDREDGRLLGLTPYLPLSVVWADAANQLWLRALPGAGVRNAAAVQPTGAPGVTFFGPTGHNLSRFFQAYWTNNGGLAQFGYPITEPYREAGPDSKAYLVQYFQRNRFEYHPENAAPYDVLLGRLGVDMSATLRQQGHGAFNHFDDAHYEHGRYFAQTGHNLRNSFLDYWNAHGGLALYGYPISEEFEQVSPTDGKTYIVQYFERNRFEYHPENKGTPNEVLLGLLGSDLLRQRGWIK